MQQNETAVDRICMSLLGSVGKKNPVAPSGGDRIKVWRAYVETALPGTAPSNTLCYGIIGAICGALEWSNVRQFAELSTRKDLTCPLPDQLSDLFDCTKPRLIRISESLLSVHTTSTKEAAQRLLVSLRANLLQPSEREGPTSSSGGRDDKSPTKSFQRTPKEPYPIHALRNEIWMLRDRAELIAEGKFEEHVERLCADIEELIESLKGKNPVAVAEAIHSREQAMLDAFQKIGIGSEVEPVGEALHAIVMISRSRAAKKTQFLSEGSFPEFLDE
jgi:hypothetical protein